MYFDHAATTPLSPKVKESIIQHLDEFGNPSSVHSIGRSASKLVRDTREILAKILNVKSHEIVFTSGATESNNAAIRQGWERMKERGNHIITTAIEHPSVLHVMEYMETLGAEVDYLAVDEHGNISIEEFGRVLREDTILVSIMMVNNEIGNLLPIREIGERLKNHQALFHVDAVQGFLHQEILPHEWGIDLLSLSAHKFNAPKGVGALFVNDKTPLSPFLIGGEQEEKRRAGTENVLGIVAMGAAIQSAVGETYQKQTEYLTHLHHIFLKDLNDSEIQYTINGDVENKSPHILNLHFPRVNNDLLLMQLDLRGIMISTGSACTAGNIEPSHVLEAMFGKESEKIKESVRVSFGMSNTEDEVHDLSKNMIEIVRTMQTNEEI